MKDFKRTDILISVLIILVTLLYFYISLFIPEGMKTVNILGFEIGSFGFIDFESFVSFIKTKILIILFASIWFLTCKYWWKPAILILIIIEFVKIGITFNVNIDKIDVIDYLISFPITIPFILMLLYISHKLNSYNLKNELRAQIDSEIDEVFFQIENVKIKELKELKMSLSKIKKEKEIMSPEKYLKELILIRNKFYNSNT